MKRSGKIVRTPSGKLGRTYNDEELLQGKVKVYLLEGSKTDKEVGVLCNPKDLKVIGFVK